jgi:hypothetical protein
LFQSWKWKAELTESPGRPSIAAKAISLLLSVSVCRRNMFNKYPLLDNSSHSNKYYYNNKAVARLEEKDIDANYSKDETILSEVSTSSPP